MKKLLILLLAFPLLLNAQISNKKKAFIMSQSSGSAPAPVDYSPLYASFNRLIIPADPATVYADVARTTLANDGDIPKGITELINGNHLSWVSSDAVRRNYLDANHGGRWNLSSPIYKKPSGDYPHISLFNMLDVLYQSSAFTALSSPNTSVYVVRVRKAVQDEGGLTFGVSLRDRGNDHLEIGNNAGSVELDAASGIPNFEQIDILFAVDNGANSTVYRNNVALGTVKTLTASSITQLYYGTNSHVIEHDLLLAGVINSVLSTTPRTNLYDAIRAFFPVNQRPQRPHLYGLAVPVFDGVDTFTPSGGTFYDPNSVAENTSAREYEWFFFTQTANISGHTGLDTQEPFYRGTNLKRGDHPNVFRGTEGTSDIYVAYRVKGYNTNGQSWGGIPFRSIFLADNTAGTKVTTGQAWVNSVTVENATPKRIDVHLTSTSGGGTFSGGNVNDFKVVKNGVEISKTIDLTSLASGYVRLTVVDDIVYSDNVIVSLIPGTTTPLQNSLGFIVPQFTTGNILAFTNNTSGPITMKVNLSWFVDGTTPPWQNVNSDGSVATIDADVADTGGNATGISLAVTNSGQGWTSSDYGSAGTLFNETNITQRGIGVWQGGNTNVTLRFAGLSAGQTFDLSYAIAKTGNGGVGNVVINGGAPIAFDSSSYTEFTSTGLTADGSGNIDFTMTITGSGDEAALIGFILTKY